MVVVVCGGVCVVVDGGGGGAGVNLYHWNITSSHCDTGNRLITVQ